MRELNRPLYIMSPSELMTRLELTNYWKGLKRKCSDEKKWEIHLRKSKPRRVT